MKMMKILLLVALFALAFSLTSCDILNSIIPQPDTDDDALLDFGDWENWGQSDWITDKYEDYDPSQNYNKIDWSKDYPGFKSETVYDLSSKMQFVASKHVQLYQAEKAALTGKANTNEGGYYVGSLDNSTVTFSINAEEECDVLLIGNFAVDKGSQRGYSFNEVFSLKHNGEIVDTSDCWLLPTLSWTVFKENCVAELHLTEGANTIVFTSAVGRTNFDYIKLVPKGELSTEVPEFSVVDYVPGIILQAENAEYSNATLETTAAGRVVVAQIQDGCSVKLTVRSDAEYTVELTMEALIRVEGEYSGKASDRFTVKVNGETLDISGITLNGVIDESGTRWWNKSYTVNSFGEITLKEGINVIEIVPGVEMNLDFFKLDVKKEITDIILQAEDAVSENVVPEGGATGTVVGTRNGSKMTFTVTSETEKTLDLYINAVAGVYDGYPANADGRLQIKVNGEVIDISSATFSGMDNPSQWWKSTYNDILLGKVNLKAGENTIEISIITTGKYGEMNIDYFFLR